MYSLILVYCCNFSPCNSIIYVWQCYEVYLDLKFIIDTTLLKLSENKLVIVLLWYSFVCTDILKLNRIGIRLRTSENWSFMTFITYLAILIRMSLVSIWGSEKLVFISRWNLLAKYPSCFLYWIDYILACRLSIRAWASSQFISL